MTVMLHYMLPSMKHPMRSVRLVLTSEMTNRAFDYVEVFPGVLVDERGLVSLKADFCALPDGAYHLT